MGYRRLFEAATAVVLFVTIAAAQGGTHVDALTKEIQGKDPSQVRATIIQRFGLPARDIGSGLQIDQWDIDGGVLTFHPLYGPTFAKNGVTRWLIHTNNPAALCLFGQYEMVSLADSHGMHYWLGDIEISPGRYTFVDSRAFPDQRSKQARNFFFLHPKGRIELKYSGTVTADTRLEELPDNSTVATITFVDGRFKETYRIVSNRSAMSLSLKGQPMQFELEKGWVNYWR